MVDQSKNLNTAYKHPSPHDIDFQLPKKGTLNEKFHAWLQGRWAVDRDDVLDNTKYNKYSAYHLFGSNPLLQNQMVWKVLKMHFHRERQDRDDHASFHEVSTHENGVFLYKSTQADFFVKTRVTDFFIAGCAGGFLTGMSSFLFLPLVVSLMSMPRKLAQVRFYTFHAELLPHTEQVVFHKTTLFGDIERHYVDIHNLEKIEASEVPAPLMWDANVFDPNMVFRCAESKEIFVFDSAGIWNADTLEHPLLH